MKLIHVLRTFVTTASAASLWVQRTPQTVQPYALKKGHGLAMGPMEQGNFFVATGNSTGGAFCIMNTIGPGTPGIAGVFPHVHKHEFENFYALKGRVQLWGQSASEFNSSNSTSVALQQARYLGPGHFGGIPPNTIHTFRLAEPDTFLAGVLVPGGFERLFLDPAAALGPAGGATPATLASYDVYPQMDFQARQDFQNASAGPGNWYNGPNELREDASQPIWIAKNYGPKWLNSQAGFYQIITPFVTGKTTNGSFAQGTLTLSPAEAVNATAFRVTSPHVTAFLMEEGQLAVTVNGFDAVHLIEGDAVVVPSNISFSYAAEAEFTKFMYVSGGANGLDAMLMAKAKNWTSAFYPESETVAKGKVPGSRI